MSELAVTTTQNVDIVFRAAGMAERVFASLIDWVFKILYAVFAFYIFEQALGIEAYLGGMDQWSAMAIVSLMLLPVMLYSLFFEARYEGQTPGKMLVGIKVVKIDGYQAGFTEYLVRWLFRFIDIIIGNGVVGIILIGLTKKSQRLGDMAAGTAVIALRRRVGISHTILEDIGQDYEPVYPLVVRLSDNDVRIIKESWERARKTEDPELTLKLRRKVESVTGIQKQEPTDSEFLDRIIKDYNFYTQHL